MLCPLRSLTLLKDSFCNPILHFHTYAFTALSLEGMQQVLEGRWQIMPSVV